MVLSFGERNHFMTASPAPDQEPSQRHQDAAEAVLDWYDRHRRDLPWRAKPDQTPNPYHVWLSEIMLQQTTVATVKSYFAKFTQIWPHVTDLAKADRDDVMAAWAGLGYYARARNLHKTAIMISEEFGGNFPKHEDELRRLPGVGAYTAAAIAAIAFGQRAVVVDGNIERVTARWARVKTPLPIAKPELYQVMDALTPRDNPDAGKVSRAGDFAQALMDIGSAICTAPRKIKQGKMKETLSKPDCGKCPLAETCASKNHDPQFFPYKKAKTPRPDRHGIAIILEDGGGNVAIQRRGDSGMLGGLDVFPSTAWADGSAKVKDYPITPDSIPDQLIKNFGLPKILNNQVEHIFTHFKVIIAVHSLKLDAVKPDLPEGLVWAEKTKLSSIALPTVMVKVARLAGLL